MTIEIDPHEKPIIDAGIAEALRPKPKLPQSTFRDKFQAPARGQDKLAHLISALRAELSLLHAYLDVMASLSPAQRAGLLDGSMVVVPRTMSHDMRRAVDIAKALRTSTDEQYVAMIEASQKP